MYEVKTISGEVAILKNIIAIVPMRARDDLPLRWFVYFGEGATLYVEASGEEAGRLQEELHATRVN